MVHINGKDIDVAGQSLMDFLNANDYEMGTFVVECNEEIIHKEDYKTYILRDGDVIEVVQFMGGGCGTSLMYRPIVRRFAFFHTLFLSLIDHIVCTVTCRQFPNLTFAPRKTRHILTATSRFIAIMSQQGLLYTRHFTYASPFFIYFCIFISTISFILFTQELSFQLYQKRLQEFLPSRFLRYFLYIRSNYFL